MASTVQTVSGGGGVDASDLTSGELLLCSFLKMKTIGGFNTYVFSLDMSKISQITFRSNARTPDGLGYVTWVSDYYETKHNYVTNETFSLNAPGGDISQCHLVIRGTQDNDYFTSLDVLSFTTTDGKVHTASNLNYWEN